jgi:predicted small metal-binding protein
MTVYRFVCDRIIPGCSTEIDAESEEKLRADIAVHLREHHDIAEVRREVDAAIFRLRS